MSDSSVSMQLFKFDESITIRKFMDDEGPILVAKDIATAMGYVNTRDAIIKHCKEQFSAGEYTKSKSRTARPLNEIKKLHPQTILIRERDVYPLVENGETEGCERFRNWLYGEVLPSIRKTGSYSVNSNNNFTSNDKVDKLDIILEELKEIKNELKELRPKAITFDLITNNTDAYSMEEAAKLLRYQYNHLILNNLTRNTLLNALRKQGIVNYKNIAYQKHINSGNFIYKFSEITDIEGNVKKNVTSTLITSKGLIWIVGVLKKEGLLPVVLFDTPAKNNVVPIKTSITIQ